MFNFNNKNKKALTYSYIDHEIKSGYTRILPEHFSEFRNIYMSSIFKIIIKYNNSLLLGQTL